MSANGSGRHPRGNQLAIHSGDVGEGWDNLEAAASEVNGQFLAPVSAHPAYCCRVDSTAAKNHIIKLLSYSAIAYGSSQSARRPKSA